VQDLDRQQGAGGEQGQGFGVGVQGLATGELVGNGAGIGQDPAKKTAEPVLTTVLAADPTLTTPAALRASLNLLGKQ